MGEAPAPTLPFLPRAWSYLARIHTGSRDTCLHMLLYVTLCYIMSENDFQIHFCFVFPLFIQNRVKLIWRQKLWKLSAIKKAPSSSKSKMKLGALFFQYFWWRTILQDSLLCGLQLSSHQLAFFPYMLSTAAGGGNMLSSAAGAACSALCDWRSYAFMHAFTK